MVNDQWNKIAPLVFYYDEEPAHLNISAKIRKFYFGNNKIGMNTLEETVNMFSDREFFEGKKNNLVWCVLLSFLITSVLLWFT